MGLRQVALIAIYARIATAAHANAFAEPIACLPSWSGGTVEEFCEITNGPPSFIGCCPENPPANDPSTACAPSTYVGGCGYAGPVGQLYGGVTVVIVVADDSLKTACMVAADFIPGASLPVAMTATTGFGGVPPVPCSQSSDPAGCTAMGQNTRALLSGTQATVTITGSNAGTYPTATSCPRYSTGSLSLYTPAQYTAFVASVGGVTSTSSARKDPHLWFAHGGRADFRGTDNGVYNLLSAKNVSMNVQVKYADFAQRNTLVHGSYMQAAAWTLRTRESGTLLRVEFNVSEIHHPHGGAAAFVTVGKAGRQAVFMESHPFVRENVRVSFANRAVIVHTGQWVFTASATPFLYAHRNPGHKLLDVKIEPAAGYEPDADAVAPHGIIGQSYDGDGVGIDGALDEVKDSSGGEVTTKAQAEGAIEGVISEYRMDSLFDTTFKYSRFDATAAKPRDVSKLRGHRVEAAHMRGGAGASSAFAPPNGNATGWNLA